MALKGVRVIEMAGLAPAPFCGMVLAHFGAKVIRVDKLGGLDQDSLAHGKYSVAVNLKKKAGVEVVTRLCNQADVLLEPFRAGIMEKLGLGPEVLMQKNPRLVYARLTGYGQAGPMSHRAGHDINYMATTGVLSLLGRKGEKPHFPLNLIADFGGGGLMCALGIVMALYERSLSGQGQVIDANMVEGASYLSSFLRNSLQNGMLWPNLGERGNNLLDGGAHFYDTYETADGKYMAVGAIEPQFYDLLLKGLNLTQDEAPHFGNFDEVRQIFTRAFKSRTQAEWCQIFDDVDACVTPVLTMDEAVRHPHNVAQKSFMTDGSGPAQASPAPRLSRTPGVSTVRPLPTRGQHTAEILRSSGFTVQDIRKLEKDNVVKQADVTAKL